MCLVRLAKYQGYGRDGGEHMAEGLPPIHWGRAEKIYLRRTFQAASTSNNLNTMDNSLSFLGSNLPSSRSLDAVLSFSAPLDLELAKDEEVKAKVLEVVAKTFFSSSTGIEINFFLIFPKHGIFRIFVDFRFIFDIVNDNEARKVIRDFFEEITADAGLDRVWKNIID